MIIFVVVIVVFILCCIGEYFLKYTGYDVDILPALLTIMVSTLVALIIHVTVVNILPPDVDTKEERSVDFTEMSKDPESADRFVFSYISEDGEVDSFTKSADYFRIIEVSKGEEKIVVEGKEYSNHHMQRLFGSIFGENILDKEYKIYINDASK